MAPTRPAEDIDAQLGEGTTAEADVAAVGVCGSLGRRRAPRRRLEALSRGEANARQRVRTEDAAPQAAPPLLAAL
eukprot:scaffold18637_cov140-Isochrysis_galbana.AAC.1